MNDGSGSQLITRPDIVLRPLNRFDMADVELLFQDAYATVDWDLPRYDPDHCWMMLIDLARRGLVVVATCEGRVIGIIALHEACWPWNGAAKFLENVHFFVDRRRRTHGVAGKLLQAAKQISDANGLPLRIAMTFGTDPVKLARWGKMNGLKVLGSNFWYQVNHN
jgi:GNAT superfamily N-acetyltransferase